MKGRTLSAFLAAMLAGPWLGCVPAQPQRSVGEDTTRAPAVPDAAERNPQRDAYFGDLHVHTSYSIDSYIFGNRLGPRDAYRFARGEEVRIYGGAVQKLSTPLDFAAVTDHAEGLEVMAVCVDDESHPQYSTPFCAGIRAGDMNLFREMAYTGAAARPPRRPAVCEEKVNDCVELAKGPWLEIQKAAAEFDEPGRFTTLVGFEYSPTLVDQGMLHRNVIFRSAAVTERAVAVWDLHTQADFWKWLDEACIGECQALAIPHNSNFSWGLTFADTNDDGRAYSPEDWQRRARLEPLVEVVQHKGNSECAVGLGTSDEECAFEQIFPLCQPGQTTRCAREGSYVRNALAHGLELEDEIGLNPYKLGFVGSTDTHNSIAGATEEDKFLGHHASVDDTAEKRLRPAQGAARPRSVDNPGGLAGVWAESNTRADIFDALRRRETFATSGTRIRVRFFGSFDFGGDAGASDADLNRAYAKGVPMGGDLRRVDVGAPTFLIWALKDPASARLDRIQVVKGWMGEGGPTEAIYDVACADGRVPDKANGLCPVTPATVGADCAPSSRHGAAELTTIWTDPHFDPARRAFYYVRVLENPTCRWSTWETLRTRGETPLKQPRTIQERAWSSPIWYSPS